MKRVASRRFLLKEGTIMQIIKEETAEVLKDSFYLASRSTNGYIAHKPI